MVRNNPVSNEWHDGVRSAGQARHTHTHTHNPCRRSESQVVDQPCVMKLELDARKTTSPFPKVDSRVRQAKASEGLIARWLGAFLVTRPQITPCCFDPHSSKHSTIARNSFCSCRATYCTGAVNLTVRGVVHYHSKEQ